MRLGQRLGLGFTGKGEIAQAAFDGSRYYRTSSGVYLKDFGHGDSDDSAKLYSGQMLDFDGVDDKIVIGDISANCKAFTCTVNVAATTTEGLIQLSSGKSLVITSGAIAVTGLTNATVYVNNVETTAISTGYSRIVVVFDAVDCDDVVLGYDGTTYLDGMLSNVQLWTEQFNADDVAFDYANTHHMLTADQNPDSDLTADNLAEWYPLIEGSGDIAYDWSGNGNHGTLTNFPTNDTQWSNADALDSLLVPQTALLEWALKTSNNACVPLDTADSTNFTRNYGELNWNGRSYADCGNGADVNPSTALIVECVLNPYTLDGAQYEMAAGIYGSIYLYNNVSGVADRIRALIYIDGGGNSVSDYSGALVANTLYHFIFAYDSTNRELRSYVNGSEVSGSPVAAPSVSDYTINTSSHSLFMGDREAANIPGITQLPLLKMHIDAKAQAIIDDDLAAWVAKRYAKAQAKYGL